MAEINARRNGINGHVSVGWWVYAVVPCHVFRLTPNFAEMIM